ncbi:Hypothetical predicted protein [Mytilus galloprovincialis]|uniref:ISXO2-like transposase domain-containing protein n=1 Tax=Mytilus galloprovincialis TaxID=29158 RepID=A0A8B6BQY3_MYTGA|nr:Hypothetical predicted protein [Mytilus galloprovincialis]
MLSRRSDCDDWEVQDEIFTYLDHLWGPHNADRFAHDYNTKCKHFNSKYWCPGTSGIDAFTVDWKGTKLDRTVKEAIRNSGIDGDSYLYGLYPKMCELLINSRSDNTVKSYFNAFKRWERFISLHGHVALPAQPVHVALYLTDLVNNGSTYHPVYNAIYGAQSVLLVNNFDIYVEVNSAARALLIDGPVFLTSISSASDSDNEGQSNLKRRKLESSKETVNDYYNYCREICCYVVENIKPQKFGGPGLIVEIDEAKFGKRKYNRGRVVEGNWVLGGICGETKEIFLMKVDKRDKDTLIPIIEQYVEKGTTIITDCWASYKCLGKLGYQHQTVNHSENFVDPTSACTNLIENRWWCIKRQLPTTHTRSKTFDKHLMEYMWRTLYTDKKFTI